MVLNSRQRQRPSRLPRRSAAQADLVSKRTSLLDVAQVSPEYRNADPTKWNVKKQTFNGRIAGNFNKEEINGKLIDDGIEIFRKNPSKYIAIMYRPADRSFPKDQQGFAYIHRAGTTRFFPMENSSQGDYILEIQEYLRLPVLKNNILPKSHRDKYTDLMTHNGKKLHTNKNKAIMPGRGMGVLDQPNMKLIGDIDPSDVKQGIVADCWLLSGVSTLAEYDGAIRRLFRKTKDFDLMPFSDKPNLYTVTLWDVKNWKEVDIVIDERLCSKPDAWNRNGENKLLGAKPSADSELWVPYLEKAAAIHCGGWDNISYGANCNHAWAILAGVKEQCIILRKGDENTNWACYAPYDPQAKKWAKTDSDPKKQNTNIWWVPWPEPGVSRFEDFEDFTDMNENTDKELFQRMCAWDDDNFLMACSSKGVSDNNKTDGIIDSHAYGIMDCRDDVADTGLDMIQLRNPWGTAGGELKTGLFVGDKGKGWKKYPQLKRELKPVENDTLSGVFWLTREEFFEYFDKIYMSARDMSEFMGLKPRPQERPKEAEIEQESRKRKAENETEKEKGKFAQPSSPMPSPKKPKPKGFVKIVKNIPQKNKNTGFAKMVPVNKKEGNGFAKMVPLVEEPSSREAMEELESRIEKYAKELKEKDSTIVSFQKALDGANGKSSNLQSKASKLVEVQKELESHCQQQKQKIEQLENQSRGLKTNDGRIASLQDQLEKAKKTIRTLEQSKKDSLRNLKAKDGTIESLRDELLEAKRTIESLGKKVGANHDRDRVKFNQVTKQLEEKQAELDTQTTKLEQAEERDGENRKRLRERDNRINSLVNKLQEAKKEGRSVGQINEESLKRLKTSDGRVTSMSAQLQEAKKTIQSLEQKNRTNRDKEHTRLRKQIVSKQAEMDAQKDILQQAKDSAIESRKELQAKDEETVSLQNALKRVNKDLQSLEYDKAESHDRERMRSKQLEKKLNNTQTELNIQAAKLQQANEKANHLEEDLRLEQIQNHRLSQQRKRDSSLDASSDHGLLLKEKDEKLDFMDGKLKRMSLHQLSSSRHLEQETEQKDVQLKDVQEQLEELRRENKELYNKQRQESSADKKKLFDMEVELEKQRRIAESRKRDVETLKASVEDKQHLIGLQADTTNNIVADLTAELEETKQELRDIYNKQKVGVLDFEVELGIQKDHSESLQRTVELHADEMKKKEKLIGALKSLKSELKEQSDENLSLAENVTAELAETKQKLKNELSMNKESAKKIKTLEHEIDLKDAGLKRGSSNKAKPTSGGDNFNFRLVEDLTTHLEETTKKLKNQVSVNKESARRIQTLEQELGLNGHGTNKNGSRKPDDGRYSAPLDVAKYESRGYDIEKYSKSSTAAKDKNRGSDLGRHKKPYDSDKIFESRRSDVGLFSKSVAARDESRGSNNDFDDSINDYLDRLAEKVRGAKTQLEATHKKVNETVGRHLASRQ
jgi:predicted  nucleic acid-binding Zn-ribbon protein